MCTTTKTAVVIHKAASARYSVFRGERSFSSRNADETRAIREVKIFDQFDSPPVRSLASSKGACSAICGYCACAVSSFLLDRQYTTLSLTEIKTLVAELLDNVDLIIPYLSVAFDAILDDRRAYIAAPSTPFADASEEAGYITAWVANYEISDVLRGYATSNVAYLRRNQTVDLAEATHVEKERLLAEEVSFPPGDDFILEFFEPRELLRCSRDTFLDACQSRGLNPESLIWIIDLKGHYNVAISIRDEGRCSLVMLDTGAAAHCDNITAVKAFELVFGEEG